MTSLMLITMVIQAHCGGYETRAEFVRCRKSVASCFVLTDDAHKCARAALFEWARASELGEK